jgi:HD-GYP domain-containing protein (c-di-GMP phosphodiesterase class II)
MLHDVGKIGVSDSILKKPGPLTQDEWVEMRRHPVIGERICLPLASSASFGPIVRHHHERWDGKGYPDGLAGARIPQEACVAGLADAWGAMTTDRPYRAALSIEQAATEVRKCRGTQFAPAVVDAFFAAFRRRPALFEPDEPYQIAASA